MLETIHELIVPKRTNGVIETAPFYKKEKIIDNKNALCHGHKLMVFHILTIRAYYDDSSTSADAILQAKPVDHGTVQ